MKQNTLLTIASVLSILLFLLHLADDIVHGFEPGGLENLIGGTIWAFGVTLLGYFLGQVDVIEQNLELAILAVVAVSCAPIAIELYRARKERRAAHIHPD